MIAPPLRRPRRTRAAFTLSELLVVTLIILLLSGIVMGALAGQLAEAKVQRTQAQVTRVHGLLMAKWETYRTRRVPLAVGGPDVGSRQLRVRALREILRMELPDRITDVLDPPVTPGLSRTALSQAYLRRIQSLQATTGKAWTVEHQSSECLYLILSTPLEDGTIPLEYFSASEIGDTDDDGVPEILDAWGNPILFLRWAPGFRSPLQTGNVADGTDQFDPTHAFDLGATKMNFALFPLVYSAGPDGIFDIVSDASTAIRYSQTSPPNNPYFTPPSGLPLGSPNDNNNDGTMNHVDNIHNHLIDAGR